MIKNCNKIVHTVSLTGRYKWTYTSTTDHIGYPPIYQSSDYSSDCYD